MSTCTGRCWIRQQHDRRLAVAASQFADSQTHWNFNRRDQSAPATLGSLEQTPNSCFFSLHLQWSPSTLRFRFTISSRYAATRLFSSVKFPRSWPTTWTWWDGSIPTAAATSPTHNHMVVKTEGMQYARCSLCIVFPFMNQQIVTFVSIGRRSPITGRENWSIDRVIQYLACAFYNFLFSF